jgi:hypothetical protein
MTNRPAGPGIVNLNIDMDSLLELLVGQSGRAAVSQSLADNLIRVSYRQILPRLLSFLRSEGVQATFLLVGRDVQLCRAEAMEIVSDGHEIGNHTQNHFHALTTLGAEVNASEIISCQQTIFSCLGVHPITFRAPGYSTSEELLRAEKKAGILVDLSIVRGWAYPLAKDLWRLTHPSKSRGFSASQWGNLLSPPGLWQREDGLWIFPVTNALVGVPMITGLILHLPQFLWPHIHPRRDGPCSPININLHLHEFITEEDITDLPSSFVDLPIIQRYLALGYEARERYFHDQIGAFRAGSLRFESIGTIIRDLAAYS